MFSTILIYCCQEYRTGFFLLFLFTFLKTECNYGSYGVNCSKQCTGHCRDGTSCNHVTGQCNKGCDKGWTGFLCNKGKFCFLFVRS